MKEKIANTALGELLLLIARDERIYRAMARLGETEVPFVLTGAIASLQQFLDEFGTPEAEFRQPGSAPTQRKNPVSTTVFSGTRAKEQTVTREAPPVPLQPDAVPPAIIPPGPSERKSAMPPSARPTAPAVPSRAAEPRKETPAPLPPSPPPGSDIAPPMAKVQVPLPLTKDGPPPRPTKLDLVPPPPQAEAPRAVPLEEQAPPELSAVVEPSPAAPVSIPSSISQEASVPEPAPAPKIVVPKSLPQVREPFAFEDQPAYVHAVSLIPLSDSPSTTPFLIEEQGLDQRCGIFAVDHAGMRFFLSELNPDSFNVSKNGMLLLSKQDSLRLRGVHEKIVNRLRQYGSVLPAEFGTAVLGKQDLSRRVEFRLHALLELVLDLGKTTTWRVTALVLDERVQRLLGPETPPQRSSRHEPERGRHGTPAKRIDVKGLERVLTLEKKIAESVLEALVPIAESHTVEQMVNLGSGRSEDWKAIVTAAFSLAPGRNPRFFKAVLDVESEQSMVELMARVTGTAECFSLLM